jgi:MFS family permease
MLINADLGPSVNIGWAATIWTMGSSIGFLLVGRLSDLFGRKWMVMSTTALSLIGTILGGCAQNVTMLIVANGCNGIGAAGQLSFGIVLGELVPNKMRGPIVTLVFLSSMPFAVFGPVIARTFIENTAPGWRLSYYIGIGLNVITLVLYQFLYHPPTFKQLHVGKTRMQQAAELDWIGIFLWIAGCVLFIIGLSWGGTTYPWVSAEVLCTLLIGAATIAGFFVYGKLSQSCSSICITNTSAEGFLCRVQPLMPPRMFRNWGFNGVIIVATVASMVYYSMTVLWPTIIGSVYTADSVQIGWDSSVVGGGVLLGQSLAGFGISYVPKVKWQTITAAVILLVFASSLGSLDPTRYAETIAFGVIATTAVGYIENIAFPGVTLLWGPQDIGLATGMLGSIRGMGGAVAQALYSSVYTNQLTDNMPKYVVPAATNAGLPADSIPALFAGITAGNFSAVPGINDEIIAAVGNAVIKANTMSFRVVFYTTIPFSVLCLIGALLVPNVEKYLTRNVAKRLQNKAFERHDTPESNVVAEHTEEKV